MSYETAPIGQWNVACWRQFYDFLIISLERLTNPDPDFASCDRNDVYLKFPKRHSNGDVGFWAFWWYCRRCTIIPAKTVYLDIHADTPYKSFLGVPTRVELLFKVKVPSVNVDVKESCDMAERVRNECSRIIGERKTQLNRDDILVPPAIPVSVGRQMTFAKVEREQWLGGDNDRINENGVLERMLENLHFYEKVLEECFVGN
jgi:hypothetical protein